MVRPEDGLAITYNGEIYNYKELRSELQARGVLFRGTSDTEVLLAAYRTWGDGCLDRIRGMFALAIFDLQTKKLFLARDRAGEKPLYWARVGTGLVFASELKALVGAPAFRARLSAQGLAFYLAYGYVPGHFCILEGVHKLPPGHYATWSPSGGDPVVRAYWDIPDPQPASPEAGQELTDELEQLLRAAVREQLQADVPVAVLLSGGVDSSLVTAIASKVSPDPIRTYSVSMRGFPRFDEAKYARAIASHFGTQHTELSVDPSSVGVIDALAQQYDEPIYDSSMIPTYLLAQTVSRECKVVLGGDGGDELFGGYRWYQGSILQERLRLRLPGALRTLISVGAERLLPVGTNKRNGLVGLKGGAADGITQAGTLFDESARVTLSPWLKRNAELTPPGQWRRALVEVARGVPGAAMAVDFRTYLPEDILVKVDRASMLCSLEVRAPFLDRRVVEFAFRRVPNALRVTQDGRKLLLKSVARRLLPPDFDLERKQGFSIPLSMWLTREFIDQWQEEYRKEIGTLFDPRRIVRMTRRPNEGSYHRIFMLVMLTKWMRHYKVAA